MWKIKRNWDLLNKIVGLEIRSFLVKDDDRLISKIKKNLDLLNKTIGLEIKNFLVKDDDRLKKHGLIKQDGLEDDS